jgi:diketogulonate reductase-like aldo/keto reductase
MKPVSEFVRILYPVLEALVKAIGLAKIGISNFAVSKLANLALSAFFSVQPEFSSHTLTLFDFRGHFTNLIRI